MTPRWMIERKYKNNTHELLQVVEVYAVGESEETVKKENEKWTYKRELLLVEGK